MTRLALGAWFSLRVSERPFQRALVFPHEYLELVPALLTAHKANITPFPRSPPESPCPAHFSKV